MDLKETCFERAIFYSWACHMEQCCTFCYMSTLPKDQRTKEKVRSIASLIAETIISKECGWEYGFLSGGIGAFSDQKLLELLKLTNQVTKKRIWLNAGPISKKQLELFRPYICGVVGSIEVLDPALHKRICPSKPIGPIERMFENARELGLECAMTMITGLGESIDDFTLLEKFIRKHDIKKIHIYGLNPQEGTAFQQSSPPTVEYQSEWIRKTRAAFPELDIQAGIWSDRVDYVSVLLKAGANSISKFPALRKFGSKEAAEFEHQAKLSGRIFKGTLIHLPNVDWKARVDSLDAPQQLKEEIYSKLQKYISKMGKVEQVE